MKVAGYAISKSRAHLMTGLVVLVWGLSDLFAQQPGSNAGSLTWLIHSHIGMQGLAAVKLLASGVFLFLAYRTTNEEKK